MASACNPPGEPGNLFSGGGGAPPLCGAAGRVPGRGHQSGPSRPRAAAGGAGTSPAPGRRPPRQRASCCFHIWGSQANLRLGRAVVIARSAIANGKEKRKQSTAPRHLAPTTQDTGAAGRQPRPMRQPLSPVLLAYRSRGPALGPGGGEDWVAMRRPNPLRDPRSKTGGISPIRLLPLVLSSSRPHVAFANEPCRAGSQPRRRASPQPEAKIHHPS